MDMRYFTRHYDGASASVAVFDTGRAEAHAFIHADGRSCPFSHQLKALLSAAESVVAELDMQPVFKRYFLSDATNQAVELPAVSSCATSVIQQPPLDGTKVGLLLVCQADGSFRDNGNGLWADSRGRIWAGDNDRSIAAASSETMTGDYLEWLADELKERGASLKDNCVRTWFFVRDVDCNYAGVVKGRNEVFGRHGLTADTHFIASTGIAGQCADTSRTVAFNAFADASLRPEQVTFLYGKTHLNPTYEYGVAFERATRVDYGDRRQIYISGTASIDNKGNIVAPGDITAQTDRMLENIGVLLAEGGCEWTDVAHMIVYLRDVADYDTVSRIFERRFPSVPKILVLAPVCRPGWLIETECMAIRQQSLPQYDAF